MSTSRSLLVLLFIVLLVATPHALSAQEGKGKANPNGATPYGTITSAGPLENIFLGADASTQIDYTGDTAYQVFPSSIIPGDYGSFVVISDTDTLYAPDFANHGGTATGALGTYTAFTPVSQSAVSGSGTAADPFTMVTVVTAGTGVRLTQTDTYIVGDQYYRTAIQLSNTGSTPTAGIFYRAMDCYLGGSDSGFGAVDTTSGAVACTENADNTPPGRIEQFIPLTAGSSYFQSFYSTIWGVIGSHQPFDNTCTCATQQDNGMGLSWTFDLAAGASTSYSHLTVFSPLGNLALSITKTADEPVSLPGDVNGYTITVNNTNPATATLTAITDTLPAGFVYQAGTTSGATAADPTINGQTLTWNGAFVIPANVSITLSFNVNVSTTIGTYYNNATASATNTPVIPTGDTAPIVVALGSAVTLADFSASSIPSFGAGILAVAVLVGGWLAWRRVCR